MALAERPIISTRRKAQTIGENATATHQNRRWRLEPSLGTCVGYLWSTSFFYGTAGPCLKMYCWGGSTFCPLVRARR